jgi:2-polyprenyl-3-methyl-5-hydroxy-6-metoxy-1,4-benzoquinol methylase
MKQLPKENIYGHTKKLKFFIERIKKYQTSVDHNISVLDFGCGNGQAVAQYLIFYGINYYGVDFHEPSIQFANENFKRSNSFFLTTLPENMKFDIILYSDIIEHLEDPEKLLKNHSSLLSENPGGGGGKILGSIPNGYGPFELEKKIFKVTGLDKVYNKLIQIKNREKTLKSSIPYNNDSEHVQFFTKKKFFELLKNCGYEITIFRKGAFIGANYSEKLTFKSDVIAKINTFIADFIPYPFVSTWYFEARKK